LYIYIIVIHNFGEEYYIHYLPRYPLDTRIKNTRGYFQPAGTHWIPTDILKKLLVFK